jgi:hypothetical protein
MVRYLLDVIGLDVNAPDQPLGLLGTPICFIPLQGKKSMQELIWLLLNGGAD